MYKLEGKEDAVASKGSKTSSSLHSVSSYKGPKKGGKVTFEVVVSTTKGSFHPPDTM